MGLQLVHYAITCVVQTLHHSYRHSLAIAFHFRPSAQVAASLLWNPNIVFSRSERRHARTFQNLEIKSLRFALFGPNVHDVGFGYAVYEQADTVSAGLQLGIIVAAIQRCMNLSNLICVAALDADFSALNRLARGICHGSRKAGLSGLNSQHQTEGSERHDTNTDEDFHVLRIRLSLAFVKCDPTPQTVPTEGLQRAET